MSRLVWPAVVVVYVLSWVRCGFLRPQYKDNISCTGFSATSVEVLEKPKKIACSLFNIPMDILCWLAGIAWSAAPTNHKRTGPPGTNRGPRGLLKWLDPAYLSLPSLPPLPSRVPPKP